MTRLARELQAFRAALINGFLVFALLLTLLLALDPAAPRAVIVYGGLAAVVGRLVGMLLRATALTVLKPREPVAA